MKRPLLASVAALALACAPACAQNATDTLPISYLAPITTDDPLPETKRNAQYRGIFDRMNEMAYIQPISTHPAVLVHSLEVSMPTISSLFSGVEYNNIKWAK